MGKEVKIGLAVIGLLLCVFGGVLAMRLKREQPANALEKVAAAEKAGKIGRKKKSIKIGSGGKDESQNCSEQDSSSATATLKQPLSSRSHRGEQNTVAKTDRYGRPLENDWTLPAESAPVQEAPGDETPALDLRSAAAEAGGAAQDRYGRSQRDPLEAQPADGDEMPAEEPSQEDVSPPGDRFAQTAGGLSFSGDEPADDVPALTDESEPPADEVAPNDADLAPALSRSEEESDLDDTALMPALSQTERESDAPRLTAAPRSSGFDFNDRQAGAADEPADDPQNLNQDDAERNQDPLGRDEPRDAAPLAVDRLNDRLGDRLRDRQGESAMLAHEAPLEDTPAADDLPADDRPAADHRPRWQEPTSGSYTVAANDNFWRISQKVYGTGAYFKALEEHNRRELGNRSVLNVGDVVSTPPIEQLQRDYPNLSPKPRGMSGGRRGAALASSSTSRGGRTYTVLEGDTLFDIARQELGKASRWAEIYDLNRDQLGEDFNYLSPGMRLAMPRAGDQPDSMATRPARDDYRR